MTEFDLIYQIFAQQTAQNKQMASVNQLANIEKNIGDDCAVIQLPCDPKTQKLVICTDTLIQGRHFSDDWQSVEQLAFAIGYKSVAVNVSDLSAMGATPHSILLAIAIPERLANQTWLSEFAKGLFFACEQFSVALIGGDTTRHDKLVITVTAQGFGQHSIYRDGAKVGDKIYVSGTLGDANYALIHPNTEIGQQLAHRLHMPTPRINLGKSLAKQKQATAMIDISDGLYQDLGHICQQSGVSMRLNLENLPCSQPLNNLKKIPLEQRLLCQLTGGDDYELAFTLPANIDICDLAKINHTPITCIGEVVAPTDEQPQITLYYQNQWVHQNNPYPFNTFPNLKGYQHFI